MSIPDAPELTAWRKSSYSAGDGGDCLEVSEGVAGVVPVRDSKDPQSAVLAFEPAAWARFMAAVKSGRLSA